MREKEKGEREKKKEDIKREMLEISLTLFSLFFILFYFNVLSIFFFLPPFHQGYWHTEFAQVDQQAAGSGAATIAGRHCRAPGSLGEVSMREWWREQGKKKRKRKKKRKEHTR